MRDEIRWAYRICYFQFIEEFSERFCYEGAPALTMKNVTPLLDRHYSALEAVASLFFSAGYGNVMLTSELIDVYTEQLNKL